MAYVATVNTLRGETLTGTSYTMNGQTIILTGSLTVTSPAGGMEQYTSTPLGATTAVIPTGDIKSVSVA